MQKVILNSFRNGKKPGIDLVSLRSEKKYTLYSENFLKEELVVNIKARFVAVCIFLFYFIENGTLGLVPDKYYFVYRNIRISDLILYFIVAYSLFYIKEYYPLVKSKSFLIAKIFLGYMLFEFALSFIRYDFNPVEYFFRLKGIWSSFLVFPYLLLIRRNGFPFLIKIIFPVAVVSNFLYVITALTGIPFLPDVSIIRQPLPGGIEVYRVFGGTFFGEIFFLGFVHYWVTKKFKMWQMFFVILFIVPHILAMGRFAWFGFVFTIILMIVLNALNKKDYRIVFRHTLIIIFTFICLIIAFIKLIPESDYYVRALNARLFQGQDDIKHNEGTYGVKVITQNTALLNLWRKNDIYLGVGMHPLWVVGPDSKEETIYSSAFSDVSWPSVLAAYGLAGFAISLTLQIYYLLLSFKLLKNTRDLGLYTFLLTMLFAKLLFDMTVGFSYVLLSAGLWDFRGSEYIHTRACLCI